MTRTHRLSVAAAAMVAAAAVGGLGAYAWSAGDPGGSPSGRPEAVATTVDPSAVVQTEFPDLEAPTGDPDLDGIDSASPATGTVVPVAGPFDDRYTITRVSVAGGTVSGRLRITSDVSEVLELQVLAGFYDAQGRFLGTGRSTYHLDESTEPAAHDAPPSEVQDFRIEAPEQYAARVVAASVGVPVLVNE